MGKSCLMPWRRLGRGSCRIRNPLQTTGFLSCTPTVVQPRIAVGIATICLDRRSNVSAQVHVQRRHFRGSVPALDTKQFKLADIGEGINEVVVTAWNVKEGDFVKEMDMVCAVESEKASVELTSPYSGRVARIYHKVQETVKVGGLLMEVETSPSSSSAPGSLNVPSDSATSSGFGRESSEPQPAVPAMAAVEKPPRSADLLPDEVKTYRLEDIGEGITVVQVTEWYVKEGDMVREMDRLCAVESEKAAVELTSPYTGKIVKLHRKVQEKTRVGDALVDIAEVVETMGVSAEIEPVAAPAVPTSVGPVKDFRLSDIGEGIKKVLVTDWLVREGDRVEEMQRLCVVESSKISVELCSPYAGTVVKLHAGINFSVKVGEILASIDTTANNRVSPPIPPNPRDEPVAPAVKTPRAVERMPDAFEGMPAERIKAPDVLSSPKIRHLAHVRDIDLNNVVGTGVGGRVLVEDLEAAYEQAAQPSSRLNVPDPENDLAAVAMALTGGPIASSRANNQTQATTMRFDSEPNEEEVFVITDNVGKAMLKSMREAAKIPTMALGEEIDVTAILKMQKAMKATSEQEYGTKVTLTSLMIKALSCSLTKHPKINSAFGPDEASPAYFTVRKSHNISIAINTPHGLMVPNIKNCVQKSVVDIQLELNRLAADAMANRLKPNNITGGTITFSNVGVIGSKDPRPIPYAGQSVIGATGRTMTLPRYNEKMDLEPRQIMHVRWVADHRHLDGAALAQFSNTFKRFMEDPSAWLLALR